MFKPRSVFAKRPPGAAGDGASAAAATTALHPASSSSSSLSAARGDIDQEEVDPQPHKRPRASKWGPPLMTNETSTVAESTVPAAAMSATSVAIPPEPSNVEPTRDSRLNERSLAGSYRESHAANREGANTRADGEGDEDDGPFDASAAFSRRPHAAPMAGAHRTSGPPKLKVSVSTASIATILSTAAAPSAQVCQSSSLCDEAAAGAEGPHISNDAGIDGDDEHIERHATAIYHGRDGYFAGGVSAVLVGRYRVMAVLGRGVFASVARCLDLSTGSDVAVKILRRLEDKASGSEALCSSGITEMETLRALQSMDHSSGANHIVRLLNAFEFEGHKCLVLERMHTSLRAICRSTSASSIKHSATSAFDGTTANAASALGPPGGGMFTKHVLLIAKHVLEGLRFMHSRGYVHADLKPDNILLDQNLTAAKICDFGTCIHISPGTTGQALNSSEAAPRHGYIAARFYRAPEVALGYGHVSHAIDIWALCVTIAEMCSGSILLRGNNNNELAWEMISLLGPVSKNLSCSSRHASDFIDGPSGSGYYVLRREPPPRSSRKTEPDEPPCSSVPPEIMPRPNRAEALQRLLRKILPPSIRDAGALSSQGGTSALSSSAKKELGRMVSIRDFFANKGLQYDPSLRCTAERALADIGILEGNVK